MNYAKLTADILISLVYVASVATGNEVLKNAAGAYFTGHVIGAIIGLDIAAIKKDKGDGSPN